MPNPEAILLILGYKISAAHLAIGSNRQSESLTVDRA